ncbi:MAG: ATP-binding cassette domain-containing protein, partial [Gemmatimonadales bacterium]|nr:ATP-binding cassette domain-containing protein [Gemmatimonadales bacterium]
MTPALQLRGVHKRFGGVRAVHGVDFTLAHGELHAVLGENGAGKSTLMHVAFGLVRADRGDIVVDGTVRAIRSPREARRLGIGMVHQHFTSVPAFSVAENIALAAGWRLKSERLHEKVRALCQDVGLPLDPAARAWTLPVALKQRLEIVKALAADVRILLLDEPTAVLAPAEADELLGVIRRFTQRGGSAVLITHKLREALSAADTVTVLRRGMVTFSGSTSQLDATALARYMIGGKLPGTRPGSERALGAIYVRAEALDIARDGREGTAVHHAAFAVRAGEIVGVAAVEGNGQRELVRAVAGLLPPLRGRLEVASPRAFVPEDRTTEGLIPDFSLTENLVLGLDHGVPWVRGRRLGRINWARARRRIGEIIREFAVDASGPAAAAASLSGGNQQKLVVARALERQPVVLVAENPTRGLDIRATVEVLARLRAAAEGGA